MDTTVEVIGLDEFLKTFDPLTQVIQAGVASVGDPSSFALVWEFGSTAIHNPGPRTVASVNPLGQPAILSSQAPHGYIRINQEKYLEAINNELGQVDYNDIENIEENVHKAMSNAAEQIRDIMVATVPVDTYALALSFEVVEPGDNLLTTQDAAVLG